MPIHLPGQGFMPASPLELLAELVILCDIENNVPLWKDVPRVNVLGITLSGNLRDESGGVIRLLGSGYSGLPLPRGHLHQKESQESS